MSEIDAIIKDIPEVSGYAELSGEEKLEFLNTQIEALKKQLYRHQCDVEVARSFIASGDSDFEFTGRQKLSEYVGQMRGAKATLDALVVIRDELKAAS